MRTTRIPNTPSLLPYPFLLKLGSEICRPVLDFQDEPGKGVSHEQMTVMMTSALRLVVFCIPANQYSLRLEGLTSPSKMSNALTSMIVRPDTKVPRVVYSSSSS
jgi:hypothetical protein